MHEPTEECGSSISVALPGSFDSPRHPTNIQCLLEGMIASVVDREGVSMTHISRVDSSLSRMCNIL